MKRLIVFIAAVVALLCAEDVADSEESGMHPGHIIVDCSECPEMVVLPAGSFLMGASEAEDKTVREMEAHDILPIPLFLGRLLVDVLSHFSLREHPQHSVTIPRPFAMGKYPVTRVEFAAFVRESGYLASPGCSVISGNHLSLLSYGGWADPGFPQTDFDPVVCVSWNDAQAYLSWLNQKVRPGTTGSYRLPSESEWEYGARAGTQTLYWWGNSIGSDNANCYGCGSRWNGKQTAPVYEFRASPFGLSTMLGDASQWTEDCPHANYEGAPADGSAWTTGSSCEKRITRGGDFSARPSNLRSAMRTEGGAIRRYSFIGFRVARTLP